MTKDTETGGKFLPDGIMKRIRAGFQGVGRDAATGRERIYFDNAGGSFRLISASERFRETDSIPDCRAHSDSDSNPDGNSNPGGNSNPDSGPYGNPDSGPYGNSYSDSYGNPYSDSGGDNYSG
mgnify:CR=1 FL=1